MCRGSKLMMSELKCCSKYAARIHSIHSRQNRGTCGGCSPSITCFLSRAGEEQDPGAQPPPPAPCQRHPHLHQPH
ncbi:unnamed protein product [Arctogadus glacialis]